MSIGVILCGKYSRCWEEEDGVSWELFAEVLWAVAEEALGFEFAEGAWEEACEANLDSEDESKLDEAVSLGISSDGLLSEDESALSGSKAGKSREGAAVPQPLNTTKNINNAIDLA